MNISLKAIAIAHYIVHNEEVSPTSTFLEIATKLADEGHFTLLSVCNHPSIVSSITSYEEAVKLVPEEILKKYRIRCGSFWLKTKEGKFARTGMVYNGFRLTGMEGKKILCGEREYYPHALNLEWK